MCSAQTIVVSAAMAIIGLKFREVAKLTHIYIDCQLSPASTQEIYRLPPASCVGQLRPADHGSDMRSFLRKVQGPTLFLHLQEEWVVISRQKQGD
jgi:hypothetical protein